MCIQIHQLAAMLHFTCCLKNWPFLVFSSGCAPKSHCAARYRDLEALLKQPYLSTFPIKMPTSGKKAFFKTTRRSFKELIAVGLPPQSNINIYIYDLNLTKHL